jgi:8-oxo-dGTP pyrophosphatase MutT (NUDIX family)
VNSPPIDLNLVFDAATLRERVIGALSKRCTLETLFRDGGCRGVRTSSVLLLLGENVPEEGGIPEAGIILNKRSKKVKQPGDLCCPGGATEKFDRFVARFLSFPGSILSRWPCWNELKTAEPQNAEFLSLLYAAGLRESWEEMRLNPIGLTFLGPLPSQCLILFRRVIHPLVAWVSFQKEFTLSWEVERVVWFPLRALLNPFNYALYRMYVPSRLEWRFRGQTVDFPCFVHKNRGHGELLWGATFRIVTMFLETIFGFRVPEIERLPLIPATVGDDYVKGSTPKDAPQNSFSAGPPYH